MPCVGITPANAAEAWVSDAITVDLKAQDLTLSELHIDRAYLSSKLVRSRSDELTIYCKTWTVRNRHGRFPKTAFSLDWQQTTICCPHQVTIPFQVGKAVRFPAQTCAACPFKAQCTVSNNGRHVLIHPDEQFFQELRQRQLTPQRCRGVMSSQDTTRLESFEAFALLRVETLGKDRNVIIGYGKANR